MLQPQLEEEKGSERPGWFQSQLQLRACFAPIETKVSDKGNPPCLGQESDHPVRWVPSRYLSELEVSCSDLWLLSHFELTASFCLCSSESQGLPATRPGDWDKMLSEDKAHSPEPSSGQAGHELDRIKIRFTFSVAQNIHHWLLLDVFSLQTVCLT